jgi:hypothetical protein
MKIYLVLKERKYVNDRETWYTEEPYYEYDIHKIFDSKSKVDDYINKDIENNIKYDLSYTNSNNKKRTALICRELEVE